MNSPLSKAGAVGSSSVIGICSGTTEVVIVNSCVGSGIGMVDCESYLGEEEQAAIPAVDNNSALSVFDVMGFCHYLGLKAFLRVCYLGRE